MIANDCCSLETLDEIIDTFRETMKMVYDWMRKVSLNLAENKNWSCSYNKQEEKWDCHTLGWRKQDHFSDVYMIFENNDRLSFKKYHNTLAASLIQIASITLTLSLTMLNVGGSRRIRRKLLASVVSSLLVWKDEFKVKPYRRKVTAVNQLVAMRVNFSYHTVSEGAFCVM